MGRTDDDTWDPASRVGATATSSSWLRQKRASVRGTSSRLASTRDVDLSDLGYDGERNEVASYLDEHGWYSVRTTLRELLAAGRLPRQPPRMEGAQILDNYYCTSTMRRTG